MRPFVLFAVALLGGCMTTNALVSQATVDVPASDETAPVGTANDDAADDPAIWVNASKPARSLIVATDKKAGLYVYGLDGKVRSQTPAGRVNNVDLRQVGRRVIVAASDRNDVVTGKIALYELDPRTAVLTPLGTLPIGPGEGYGLCLWQPRSGPLNAFVVMKEGDIFQVELALGATPTATLVRRMKLTTQSEGCVADDRTGILYVAEEDVGIWRFGARKTDPVEPLAVAKVEGQRLVADVEGLAIAATGRSGGYLVASSQGDNAYVLYRLPDLSYAGRFRIVANGSIGGTSETDGIDVTTATFPGYPDGLFIAQDGDNLSAAQNFKLVRWHEVLKALKLKRH
jgi:myo-inositol-hexaphosphate 3-phosphohydrolase